MRDYARIAMKIRETNWLITPEGLSLILNIMDSRMQGERLSDEEIKVLLEGAGAHGSDTEDPQIRDGVGVLPIYGPIFGKANMMTQLSGATSMEQFRSDLRSMLADDNVKSIIMDIDSPGGSSEMIAEAGEEILAGRDIKPIYAMANNMAGSAALWLASQASQFYTTPSGSVGSLGVYTVHDDQSGADAKAGHKITFVSAGRYKTEGNPHEPLSAEGVAYRQEVVDELHDNFLSAVANGRGKDVDHVRENFGQGRMLMPKKALEVGMVDGIMEFDALVSSVSTAHKTPQRVSVVLPGTGGKVAQATFGVGGVFHLDYDEDGVVYMDSVADWEHSEPGTGTPPAPREPESTDKAIEGGWRRGDLPTGFPNEDDQPGAPKAASNDGGNMDLSELYQLFGVDNDEALLSAIKDMHTEASALRGDVSLAGQEREFATKYPDIFKRMQEDREKLLGVDAQTFVDAVSTIGIVEGESVKPSSFGLSALAADTVKETYLKFANGQAGLADFESCIRQLTQGGLVEYGERGSSKEKDNDLTFDTSTAMGVQAARQLFASKVNEIISADKLEYAAAVEEASKRYPELAQAYRATAHA